MNATGTDILSDEAVAFVTDLERRFGGRRRELLDARRQAGREAMEDDVRSIEVEVLLALRRIVEGADGALDGCEVLLVHGSLLRMIGWFAVFTPSSLRA